MVVLGAMNAPNQRAVGLEPPLPKDAFHGSVCIGLLSMSYTEPVSFSSTNNYGCGPDDEDDVYTVEEFKHRCEQRAFVDYDGFGHPVKDGKADESIYIYPSKVSEIPSDATHIVWFNR